MRQKIYISTLALTTIFWSACTNNQQVEDLQKQNDELRNTIDSIKSSSESHVFAYCILSINSPEKYDSRYGYVNYSDKSVASEIKEIFNFNEDERYKFLDEFEAFYRTSEMKGWPIKVLDRHCATFKSYAEASKDKNSKFK